MTDKAEKAAEVVTSARLSNDVRRKKTAFECVIYSAHQLVSKLRKLDGFIQHFTSNLMALDLKLEDTLTFKQGKAEGEKKNRDKMILSLYRNTRLSIQKIAQTADVPEQYVIDLIKESEKEEPQPKKLPKKRK